MQAQTKVTDNLGQSSFYASLQGQKTKTIAENIFKDLKSNGFADKDIVAISSEILDRLTEDIKRRHA